jgi:CheY-like chemotaxis protein
MVSILLVDDDVDNRFLMSRLLRQLGCEVTAFADAESAFFAFKTGIAFDVIFTDFHMPRVNGLEFLKAVKRYHPTTRVVLMSASNNPDIRDEALASGAAYFLSGGYDLDTVKPALDAAMVRP